MPKKSGIEYRRAPLRLIARCTVDLNTPSGSSSATQTTRSASEGGSGRRQGRGGGRRKWERGRKEGAGGRREALTRPARKLVPEVDDERAGERRRVDPRAGRVAHLQRLDAGLLPQDREALPIPGVRVSVGRVPSSSTSGMAYLPAGRRDWVSEGGRGGRGGRGVDALGVRADADDAGVDGARLRRVVQHAHDRGRVPRLRSRQPRSCTLALLSQPHLVVEVVLGQVQREREQREELLAQVDRGVTTTCQPGRCTGSAGGARTSTSARPRETAGGPRARRSRRP